MMFELHYYAIYDENTGTAHDGHFSDPNKFRLSYQTYHFEIVSFLLLKGAYPYHLLLVYLPE